MRSALFIRATFVLAGAVGALVLLAPHASLAQSEAELRATIKAELLSDPRTSGLTDAQLSAMVDSLTQEAVKRGLSASDITWRPAPQETAAADTADTCGGVPAPLCALNRAFGFDGSDPRIPTGLGITSALLLVIIGLMLEMRHRAAAKPSVVAAPLQQ